MSTRTAAAIAAMAVLVCACGSVKAPGAPTARATSSSSAASSGQPSAMPASPPSTPTSTANSFDVLPPARPVSAASAARFAGITCSGAIGTSDSVAIVKLHSGDQVFRDYADPAHPRTVCHFPADLFGISLVDARHVVIAGESNLYALVDLPGVTYRWFQLPDPGGQFPTLVAVAPSLDAVAYIANGFTSNTDDVHLATKAGNQVVASLPNPHAGRCGSPEDSKFGAYSHSGSLLYVLDQPFPTLNSLLVLQGGQTRLLFKPPGQTTQTGWAQGTQPAMPLWSPTAQSLYYRKAGDVWRWTPAGGSQVFLKGVTWYYPSISADGSHLAYAVLRPDGLHNVYLVDLAHGGSPLLIGKGARNLPVFLNSTQLWYRSEGQGICGPSGDQPLVYDLTDGSETSSIIDFVGSVWPSTSSNF